MLHECDLSDPDDVLSESDEELIPQVDASKAEVNLKKVPLPAKNSDGDSDEDCKITVANVTLSVDLQGQRPQLCPKFSAYSLLTKLYILYAPSPILKRYVLFKIPMQIPPPNRMIIWIDVDLVEII